MKNTKSIGFSEMSQNELLETDGGLIFLPVLLVVGKVAKGVKVSKGAKFVAGAFDVGVGAGIAVGVAGGR